MVIGHADDKMQDGEEFQTVTHRKRGKKLKNKHYCPIVHHSDSEESISTDDLIRIVLAAVVEFRKSPYNQIIFNGFSKSLNALNSNTIAEVICYGLGSFSQNKSSKYQLATLLTIKNRYNCDVLVYDPVFTEIELKVLKILELNVIKINEEGKHIITCNRLTLVFMPHCPSQLLNNFLYCNWGTQLKNCIILCNSWSEVFDQNPLNFLKNAANYISRIYPYVLEIKLENKFEFVETFSATSIHIFPELHGTPLNFWHPNEEPVYPNGSNNFVMQSLSNST